MDYVHSIGFIAIFVVILCDHMGKPYVIRHSKTKSHQDQARSLRLQPPLSFAGPSSTETSKRTEVELKMAVLMASSNVFLAFHNQFHQLSERAITLHR